MTLFNPTFVLRRLVVHQGGNVVYDESFHSGVNVIRGENSSGKSTILNFIFYALGGDLADWSPMALACTRVSAEVDINGMPATLSREISDKQGREMWVFGGRYEDAKQAPLENWTAYPYRRSSSVDSFSQMLFRLMRMPEVSNDDTGAITMHQILRILYADQLSPVESLFRFERFDRPALRDAVGRLLCGAYDNDLYQNQLRIRELNKEFDELKGQLTSLHTVLGQAGHNLSMSWVSEEIQQLEKKKKDLIKDIVRIETEQSSVAREQFSLSESEGMFGDLKEAQKKYFEARDRVNSIEISILDSERFIKSLEGKLKALLEASSVADVFGEVKFQFCPACFSSIEEDGLGGHICHLCKSPYHEESARNRLVSLISDVSIQLKQSQSLQARRKEKFETEKEEAEKFRQKWESISIDITIAKSVPSSVFSAALRERNRSLGYIDREIEDLYQRRSLISRVDVLSERKANVQAEIDILSNENDKIIESQKRQLSKSYDVISNEVKDILLNDLPREQQFVDARLVEFSFSDNKISVNGESYFSASSRVVLKSAFYLGFLSAAIKDRTFRHPRFVMIDTTEDKGMEPERSHNFQRQVVSISEAADVEHQIIYATAMIAPEINDSIYTVGEFSTHDSRTLKVRDK